MYISLAGVCECGFPALLSVSVRKLASGDWFQQVETTERHSIFYHVFFFFFYRLFHIGDSKFHYCRDMLNSYKTLEALAPLCG